MNVANFQKYIWNPIGIFYIYDILSRCLTRHYPCSGSNENIQTIKEKKRFSFVFPWLPSNNCFFITFKYFLHVYIFHWYSTIVLRSSGLTSNMTWNWIATKYNVLTLAVRDKTPAPFKPCMISIIFGYNSHIIVIKLIHNYKIYIILHYLSLITIVYVW